MGLLHFLHLYAAFVAVMVVMHLLINPVESTVLIRFHQTPPALSRHSYAVFRYSFETLRGLNACQDNSCSIHSNVIVLKNLTVNRDHEFLLNVTTSDGQRNSTTFSWFIDTVPPTATIFSKQNYTNDERVAVEVTFSEPCNGPGGFKCVNSSNCDLIIKGSAHVIASSLRIVKPGMNYNLDIIIPMTNTFGRVVITMRDGICTDQAGNQFIRTNGSTIIIHFDIDRRPVQVDLWTSVPSYELVLDAVPRTVLATNKMEDLKIFLDFSSPIINTTAEVLMALHVNSGNMVPIYEKNRGNRRFDFELKNVSRTEIITIELQAYLIIGKTGAPVSPAASITFLYDSLEPGVWLSTSSPNFTKESNINVIVEFTKPVFGFEASMVDVTGGALYSVTVLAVTQKLVSVTIPAGRVNDISGNPNLASNQLQVKHYSIPLISAALHSFMTAGILATSLAAAVLSVSYANLGAIDTLASGSSNIVASDPSINLHGMVGHIQVFVLSDWLSVNHPIEYSETTKGLRWLIPHQKLPWKEDSASVWPNHVLLEEDKLPRKFSAFSEGWSSNEKTNYQIDFYATNNSYMPPVPLEIDPKSGKLRRQHNMNMRNTPYGQNLDTEEYIIYFLRGEPLSASNVVKRMENDKGWEDLEMNLFWLGVGGGGLVILHVLIVLFLRWRTGTTAQGILLVPRFELFLLILMLPCISQSSAFVIRGGTTGGIITGALLLAIPAAFILSVCLFLIIAIFSGVLAQYKEVKNVGLKAPWYRKLWFFITMRPIMGMWFCREGLPSSFYARFGILFDTKKGPPLFVFVDRNDPNTLPKWTESGHNGIGRMRAVSSDDSNEEIRVPLSRRLLGCARSFYTVIDLLRRISLGIISGTYSSEKATQSMLALTITLVQFMYLFTLKPYIGRGVHMVESVSLLCEVGIFVLFITTTGTNPTEAQHLGFIMLAFLFISFVTQLINEWYALINSLVRLSHPHTNSLKLGLKFAARGLILPFLPRKHWSTFRPASSQPKIGLAPVLPLSPEREVKRRDMRAPCIDPISSMSATVVPVLSPGSPSPDVIHTLGCVTAETNLSGQRAAEGRRLRGPRLEPKSDLKKLREMARASFSGDPKGEEPSTSYGYRL
ncbi:hypothetical protein FEM48_Zijuj09G0220400 [Ziziphus jujuba var. spinosa]|uniref:Bacterial Ig-like domain-containing protein n=1 Tax=Ziziphus jujuba var. spinosa TaxID=714518 RepID=A0A978UVK2_ZIZJJ|nr:hypothetical protein FEM48_Zijuj09G0220400 [Ziziphus jujuba var. spinosa]